MRKLFLLVILLSLYVKIAAQTVVVTDDATYTTGQASSVLDVKSTSKGFLTPRMTQAQRTAIASPTDGLLVYQTDAAKGFYNYNSTLATWVLISSGAGSGWNTTGNSGTTVANYLGTSDNFGLRFRTNNTKRMTLDSLGNVAIGTSPVTSVTNPEKFIVDAGVTTSFNVIHGRGSINNYLQLNIQNISAGTAASSDIVATADNGNENVKYIDMGINSSGNTAAFFGAANDAYLYNEGQNLLIGTSTAAKSLIFLTGGGVQSTNERMRIDGTGKVGIGTNSPSTLLHVFGANPLTLSGVVLGTSTSADSVLTITSGLVRKLPVSTFTSTGTWNVAGNSGLNANTNFLGTTSKSSLKFRTSNNAAMILDSLGHLGIGLTNPAYRASIKDSLEIRNSRSGSSIASLIFTNTAGVGDLRVAGDGVDLFWQGGGGRSLQMGSYWTTVLMGDRQVSSFPAYISNAAVANVGVLVQAQRDASIPMLFMGNSGTQTANLTEWRTSAGTGLSAVDKSGKLGVGTTTPAATLDVSGTYKLGTAGTALTNMIKTNVAVSDATSITSNTSHQITITVTGATVNASLIINPRSALSNGLIITYSYVSSTNNVLMNFFNADGSAHAVGNVTFDITVIQ